MEARGIVDLHEALRPLQWLLGTWRGTGRGKYPSIEPFEYREESRFWHTGRPQVFYLQQTWNVATGAPTHSETGYLRPVGEGAIEIVLAHSFGNVEISEGRYDATSIEVASRSLVASPTAKTVAALTRRYRLDEPQLSYSIEMQYGSNPLQIHLEAELVRDRDSG